MRTDSPCIGIVSRALAAGFTHVQTFAGPVPLQLFAYRDALGYVFDPTAGAILGPWRAATTAEELAREALGHPPSIGVRARDRWQCLTIEPLSAGD